MGAQNPFQLINRIKLFIYLPDLASAIGIFKQFVKFEEYYLFKIIMNMKTDNTLKFVNKTFQTPVY